MALDLRINHGYRLATDMKMRLGYGMAAFAAFMALYGIYNPFIATYALLGMEALEMLYVVGRKKTKAIDWAQFFFVAAFGIITLIMRNPIMIQLRFPVLGIIVAMGMLAYRIRTEGSIIKALAKDFNLPKLPDNTWKQMDYIIIANLLIKAAINISCVFAFPELWYYANFVLPLFDIAMLGGMYFCAHEYLKHPQYDLLFTSEHDVVSPVSLPEKANLSHHALYLGVQNLLSPMYRPSVPPITADATPVSEGKPTAKTAERPT